jgi:hypothetical protein
LKAMMELEGERRRDGAFAWNIFEDLAQKGRFVETFMLDSWLEDLRQHERVTGANETRNAGDFQNRSNYCLVDFIDVPTPELLKAQPR